MQIKMKNTWMLLYLTAIRKKGTDHPKADVDCVTILVFERFWVVSPFFTPVSFFITYPARQLRFAFILVIKRYKEIPLQNMLSCQGI